MRRAALLSLIFLLLCVGIIPAAAQDDPTPTLPYCATQSPYTATPVPTYKQKVLSYSPIAYWALDETAGTIAIDSTGLGRHGTYSGVTLGATTFVDGNAALGQDGVNDTINLYSSALMAALNPNAGTILYWFDPVQSSWAGGVDHIPLSFNSTGNTIGFRWFPTGAIEFRYRGQNVNMVVANTLQAGAIDGWVMAGGTWSNTAKLYLNGSLAAESLSIDPRRTSLGTGGTSSVYNGYLAHIAIFDYELSPEQIAALYAVPMPPGDPTPTPDCIVFNPTPTPTADIYAYWTLSPNGTPGPGQDVAFEYKVDAGQVSHTLILVAILFSLWAMFVSYLLFRRKTVGGG